MAAATVVATITPPSLLSGRMDPGACAQAVSERLLGSQTMEAEQAPGSDEHRQSPHQVTDWATLVSRIHDGEAAAMEELYGIFAKGIRYFLLRNLGPDDLDDKVHDCFVIVTQAIRNGDLREPERLMGYVRTVVKRQIAGSIDSAVQQRRNRVEFDDSLFSVSDWRDNPESSVIARQRADIARKVLNGVSRRDREILKRFYVMEQSQEQICAEMTLTYNQFRLLKSRAKARFGELGKRLAAGMGVNLRKS
jgi:RNA polymerase sigma-70 factor (ECF subfamily)